MVKEDRETILNILESRKFQIHMLCFSVCLTNLLILNKNECWKKTYLINQFLTTGLTTANYMGLLASTLTLMSWILIDDISWFGKAFILLKVGILMTICGAYFTIKFLNDGNDVFECNANCEGNTYWIPIVTTLNFIEGVVAITLTIYVCITLDGRD